MASKSPKEVLLAWHAAFVARDVDALCELYADEAVNHQVAEEPLKGKEAIRRSFEGFFAAFPDEKTEILNLFESGDWAIWEWRGGPINPRPDSDQRPFHGCGFFQIRDGKIVFQRGYWDKLMFLRVHNLPLSE
jgi:steroid delta-isomerase-like uncharacterized protein